MRAAVNQKLRTGAERLANWLLTAETAQGNQGALTLDIEKRVLASHLGMMPENLSRAFATLVPHSLANHGVRILITDQSALRPYAAPDPLIDAPE